MREERSIGYEGLAALLEQKSLIHAATHERSSAITYLDRQISRFTRPFKEEIIRGFYGLDGHAKTYDDLARELNLPADRITKIHTVALGQLAIRTLIDPYTP